MFKITTVVQTVRRRLPFGEGNQPTNDGDAPDPASSGPASRSDVYVEQRVSPEDYIIKLCRSHGGRMKQQTIVEETEWSESMVSRLLSDMEADGHIVRISLGREKVVAMPERLPGRSGADRNPA